MTIEPSKFSTKVLGKDAVVLYDGEIVGVLSPHMLNKAKRFAFKPQSEWPPMFTVVSDHQPDEEEDAEDFDDPPKYQYRVTAQSQINSFGVWVEHFTDAKCQKWLFVYKGSKQLGVFKTLDEVTRYVREEAESRHTPGAMLRHLFPYWEAIKEMP